MIELTDDEKPKYERMVEDAMRAFGYSRARAETMAEKMVERFRKLGYFPEAEKGGRSVPHERAAVARPPQGKKKEVVASGRGGSVSHAGRTVSEFEDVPPSEPAAPIQNVHRPMTAPEKEYYERMVSDGMKRRRHCRSKAKKLARMAVKRFRMTGVMEESPEDTPPKKPRTKQKLTRAEIAKLPPAIPPRPPPRNAKERMERALGPDEGERRRRGGSPVLQGGSPGLGRRR